MSSKYSKKSNNKKGGHKQVEIEKINNDLFELRKKIIETDQVYIDILIKKI